MSPLLMKRLCYESPQGCLEFIASQFLVEVVFGGERHDKVGHQLNRVFDVVEVGSFDDRVHAAQRQ